MAIKRRENGSKRKGRSERWCFTLPQRACFFRTSTFSKFQKRKSYNSAYSVEPHFIFFFTLLACHGIKGGKEEG